MTLYEYNEYLRTGYKKYEYDHKYNDLIEHNITPKEIKKRLKIYNIDINKCIKNNLYYSKYDLPLFTVMDKIKCFNQDIDKLSTGIYYLETKQYFPLIGNGWYSYPMIDYCLDNKLITLDDIKF